MSDATVVAMRQHDLAERDLHAWANGFALGVAADEESDSTVAEPEPESVRPTP